MIKADFTFGPMVIQAISTKSRDPQIIQELTKFKPGRIYLVWRPFKNDLQLHVTSDGIFRTSEDEWLSALNIDLQEIDPAPQLRRQIIDTNALDNEGNGRPLAEGLGVGVRHLDHTCIAGPRRPSIESQLGPGLPNCQIIDLRPIVETIYENIISKKDEDYRIWLNTNYLTMGREPCKKTCKITKVGSDINANAIRSKSWNNPVSQSIFITPRCDKPR